MTSSCTASATTISCSSSTPEPARRISTGSATPPSPSTARVENLSDAYTQIAIQGPNGWRTLQKLTDADLTQVKFYWFTHGTVCGLPNTLIARTGYTAEDGFEIYIPSDEPTSLRVWNELLAAGEEFGILPCGLGARNTLRLEGALSLYGHEISDTITPWEARLDRFVKMDKGDFIGRDSPRRARSRRGPETHPRRPGGHRARHPPRRLPGHRLRRPPHRLRHQRLARALSQEEHRPRLCSPRAFRRGHRAGRGGSATQIINAKWCPRRSTSAAKRAAKPCRNRVAHICRAPAVGAASGCRVPGCEASVAHNVG